MLVRLASSANHVINLVENIVTQQSLTVIELPENVIVVWTIIMKKDVIIEALRRAGATFEGETPEKTAGEITKADLMDLGLYGPGSNERRAALIKKLGFPEKMSTNAFLQAVNLLFSIDELKQALE